MPPRDANSRRKVLSCRPTQIGEVPRHGHDTKGRGGGSRQHEVAARSCARARLAARPLARPRPGSARLAGATSLALRRARSRRISRSSWAPHRSDGCGRRASCTRAGLCSIRWDRRALRESRWTAASHSLVGLPLNTAAIRRGAVADAAARAAGHERTRSTMRRLRLDLGCHSRRVCRGAPAVRARARGTRRRRRNGHRPMACPRRLPRGAGASARRSVSARRPTPISRTALRLAREACALAPRDSMTLTLASGALTLAHRLEDADRLLERALALDPWSPIAWLRRGWASAYRGDSRRRDP